MEVALAHKRHAGREGRDYSADDFRSGLLEGLCENADAELKRGRAREADLEAIVGEIDIVRRIAFPYREDNVDRFSENLVAILVQDADRFRIGCQRTGADAQHEA